MDIERILALVNQAVLEKVGRNLRDPETVILRGTWQGLTYEQMSKPASKYSENYLMRDVGRDLWKLLSEVLGEEVNKSNFRYVIQQQQITSVSSSRSNDLQIQQPTQVDWSDAPQTSVFYGREKERKTLQQWITQANCNLIAITGLPQMGKTFFTAKVVEEIQNNFDYVIWRSLSKFNWKKLLKDWFYHLDPNSNLDHLVKQDNQLENQLIEYLRIHKCLLIIDNINEIDSPQTELNFDSEKIISKIATETHNSCLLIVGETIPEKISLLVSENPRINHLICLSKYTEQEIEKFLQQENIIYNQKDVNWLYQKCLGIPQSFVKRLQRIKVYCNNNIAFYRSITDYHDDKKQSKPTDTILEIISRIIFDNLSEMAKEIVYFLYNQKDKQAPIDKIFQDLCNFKSGNKNQIEELKLQIWNAVEELRSQHEAIDMQSMNIKLQDIFINYLDYKKRQNQAS